MLDGIIRQVQRETSFFHHKDVELRPIEGKNGKCQWDGNECTSFIHIALLVLVRVDAIKNIILKMWYHFLKYVSAFHCLENTKTGYEKGIKHFQKTKKILKRFDGIF